jgi:hypothetical protein
MCKKKLVKCCDKRDGEDVGNDVFGGEVAAEEDLAGKGQAEGVNGGDGDEATEFDHGGYGDREYGGGERAEFGEEGGEEPVECDGPEGGAEVLVEEPGKVEREVTDGEADGDGDEEKKEADDSANRVSWSHALYLLQRPLMDSGFRIWTKDWAECEMLCAYLTSTE